MKIQWVGGVVGLGTLLIVFAGISPAVGEINKMGGEERAVTEAMETGPQQFGEWEYWLAVETGTLPLPEAGSGPAVQATEPASPQFGTWEYWLAEETGTLRGTEVSRHSSEIVERPEW